MARKQWGWLDSRTLAWGLFGWSTVAAATAIVLGQRIDYPLHEAVSEPVIWVVFALVGALVAAQHPNNVVGWLLVTAGCLGELNAVAERYAALGLVQDPSIATRR